MGESSSVPLIREPNETDVLTVAAIREATCSQNSAQDCHGADDRESENNCYNPHDFLQTCVWLEVP